MSRKTVAAKFQDEEYDITVTGRNVMVTEAMKSYAIEKISKIDRFNNRVTDVNVTMDIQKVEHRVDLMLKVDQLLIKSSAVSDDMYSAIDKAVDRLQTQLRRYKRRIRDHHLKSGSAIDMNVNIVRPGEEVLNEINDEIESANANELFDSIIPHAVISRETRPLKTLNSEEAIMKLELSGDIFLLYRAEEDRKLKVIYRRNDGHLGIIEPE